MASKKKESEGIALLSMYNDEEEEEDEEMEDVHEQEQIEKEETLPNLDTNSSDSIQETSPSLPQSRNSTPREDWVPTPIPSESSPQLIPQPSKRRALAIVDYGHDETAMSPEPEEGEIMGGEDLQPANGNVNGNPGSGQTPNIGGTPQPSEKPELLHADNSTKMTSVLMESETVVVEETVMISVEIQRDVDPLDDFLPPPPETMCSNELQEKINKFLALKRLGKSFNAEVRNRKDYRNPDFLLHAVRYQDIDQIGSCFSKDVFDPHGYDKSDYYDEIEADMKREIERKEQERKKSQRLDFVAGGTQIIGVAAPQRSNIQNPVISTVASTGFHSHPTPAESMARDSRQNKKSKWDKGGDGDVKNPIHVGGQDALSAAASLLPASSVGVGYSSYSQQKRKEAEGKRCNDKRRS